LTNRFLVRVAYRFWEVSPVGIASLSEQKYGWAIVLGGFGRENEVFGDRFEFSESANRLTQALEIYHQGRVKRVIVTGERVAVERFLKRLKFPKEGLLVEGAFRNSSKNRTMTSNLLKEKGADKEAFLLYTDGWHMRRSGLKVIPFSSSGERPLFDEPTPDRQLVPDTRGFERWSKLAKEMVVYGVYRATGKL